MANKPKRRKKRSRRRDSDAPGGGSMMSMRRGMKNIAGTGKRQRPEPGSSFLTWLVVIVVLIVLVLWLIR